MAKRGLKKESFLCIPLPTIERELQKADGNLEKSQILLEMSRLRKRLKEL